MLTLEDLKQVKVGDILCSGGVYEYQILAILDITKDGLWARHKEINLSLIPCDGLFTPGAYTLKHKKPIDKKQAVLDKIKYLDKRYKDRQCATNTRC